MIRELKNIKGIMEEMVVEMKESNNLMRKLTKQLEIISLPPDMVKWAKEKEEWE